MTPEQALAYIEQEMKDAYVEGMTNSQADIVVAYVLARDYKRLKAKIDSAQPEVRRSLPPDTALLERCREICMRVIFEAEEAAKAKDATNYAAGYQDAC